MNPDSKRFLQYQIMWIGISLAMSFAISWFVPFPLSLVVIIGMFMGMNYFIRKRQMRRLGMASRSLFGTSIFGGERVVNYYCINCGMKHNARSCPRCGSNATRIG